MDETTIGIRSPGELVDALKEMILGEDGYRCLVAVVFYADGARLVIHGTSTLEIEVGMLGQAIQFLWSRISDLRLAIHEATIREEKGGTN
jgi:hypothetical protein